MYQNPVRVKVDGEWADVDPTLVKQDDGTFRPTASATDIVISGGGSKDAGKVTFDDGHSVTVTWPEALPAPTVDGATATYKLSATADLLMIASGDGISARVRLNERPVGDDPVVTFGLRTDDLAVAQTPAGGLAMTDDAGKTLAGTSPLVAWDSRTDEAGEPLEKVALTADLDQKSKNGDIVTHDLQVTAPDGFLSDPDTEYPVIIDPDVRSLGANSDTWVQQNNMEDHGANYDLRVGKQGTTGNLYPAITYIKWNLDRIPAGSSIVSAQVGLTQFWAGGCGATTVQVQPLANNWSPSVLYSTPKPDALQQDAASMAGNKGNQCGNAGVVTVPATTWVSKWWAFANGAGGYQNYGLRFGVPAANETQTSWGRRFCSYQSGLNSSCGTAKEEPYLSVTYNRPPAVPSALDVTRGGNPATVYATLSDPDTESNLRAQLKVYKKDSTTVVWEGPTNGAPVSPGGSVQVSGRLPYLPDGTYEVTATAYDDVSANPTPSGRRAFVIDTEFGSQSWYSTTQHQLGDRSSIQVNNKTGNLAVQASDVNVNGIGVDLGLTRFYNSQSTQLSTQGALAGVTPWATSLGAGWSLSGGPDVWLEKRGDNYWYHAPGGTVFGPFEPDTSTSDPNDFKKRKGGVDADLTKSGTTLKMAFRHSQTRYDFEPFGTTGDVVQRVSKDRSGNRIQFNYAAGTTPSGRPKLTSITDSSDRSYAVTYTGDQITKIAETGTGAREWNYGYTAGFMTSYTDPASKVTNYGYAPTATATGSKPLIKIEDPQTASAPRVTTTFDYHPAGPNLDRVQAVHYAKSSGTDNFAWTYTRRNTDPTCENKSDYSSNVLDARAKTTSYCFKDADNAGKTVTRVYDAMGNAKQTRYTADQGTDAFQAASNSTATGDTGSTVAQYGGGDFSDQLASVTEPKTAADVEGGSTKFSYGTEATAEKYQPKSSSNSNGECSMFDYNEAGQTTAAYTGLTAASCTEAAKGSKNGFHRKYNPDGTVSQSWDSNAGQNVGDSNSDNEKKTLYTYWDSNDAPGSKGQLKTIRKPGGSCDAPRNLCTTYTYDARGRVATVTDGRGKVTTYSYDALDRTIQVLLDGGMCPLVNCVTYTYDAEGNMTRRADPSGQTAFEYDRLNRQVGQRVFPAGSTISDPQTILSMSYDGNGNLTGFGQSVFDETAVAPEPTEPEDCPRRDCGEGETDPFDPYVGQYVTYAYDNANRLKTVTDASGPIDILTDKDGRVSKTTFPNAQGAPGISVNYDFKKSGKPQSITIKNAADDNLRRITYDYTKSVAFPGVAAVQMESSQIQERDTTKTPDGTAEGKLDYEYDDDQRLKWAHNANGALPDYDYTYDQIGNITKEQVDSDNNYFGYDRAGQLCWKDSAAHDADQLNTSCQNVTGATNYNHDAAGNNTNIGSAPRTYNDNSQLTQNGGVNMAYSDLGNPIRTQAGSTAFVNSPLGITARKTGSVITFYTRDSNGQILSAREGGVATNYVSEYNGSVVALYNNAGGEVGSYRYSPYGRTTATGAAAEANPFRYIGGYQDKDAAGNDGFYKLGARYYDTQGHFTQPDAIAGSIGDPKTLTSYNYSGGDPINSADPSGNSLGSFVSGAVKVGGLALTAAACAGTAGAGCVAAGIGYGLASAGLATAAESEIDGLSGKQTDSLLIDNVQEVPLNIIGGGLIGKAGRFGKAIREG